MIAMPEPKEYLKPTDVYPTTTSIDRSSFIKLKKKAEKSLKDNRTYQDTLGNKGDSTVHCSVSDIHVVGR